MGALISLFARLLHFLFNEPLYVLERPQSLHSSHHLSVRRSKSMVRPPSELSLKENIPPSGHGDDNIVVILAPNSMFSTSESVEWWPEEPLEEDLSTVPSTNDKVEEWLACNEGLLHTIPLTEKMEKWLIPHEGVSSTVLSTTGIVEQWLAANEGVLSSVSQTDAVQAFVPPPGSHMSEEVPERPAPPPSAGRAQRFLPDPEPRHESTNREQIEGSPVAVLNSPPITENLYIRERRRAAIEAVDKRLKLRGFMKR